MGVTPREDSRIRVRVTFLQIMRSLCTERLLNGVARNRTQK